MDTKQIKTETSKTQDEKKKQKISVSYTLKAFGNNIDKMEEAKLISGDDLKTLKEIKEKTIKTWIGYEFKM